MTTLHAGFAISFHILLPRQQSFDNPITSTIKVLVMMSGEFEFDEIFLWDQESISIDNLNFGEDGEIFGLVFNVFGL